MNQKKSSNLTAIALFFAAMLVIHVLSSIVFSIWPVPIRPTLTHIPVIIAAIVYGPRVGSVLGLLMGIISVVTNTVIILPTSYLFSPFVENGNLASLVIAIIPRVLIGIFPYFIYKWLHSKTGLALAGAVGSLTNTVFVITGIFIFFSSVYRNDIQTMLAAVITASSLAELLISIFLTSAIVPTIERLKK
ncbi:ECF transporter S component [Streptococcus dentapri]|uniref:ECF transporter S component n=1 Tax=Streptococcus dentapri TaxID=573564 RepID=A0ABV8D1V3_9STRE